MNTALSEMSGRYLTCFRRLQGVSKAYLRHLRCLESTVFVIFHSTMRVRCNICYMWQWHCWVESHNIDVMLLLANVYQAVGRQSVSLSWSAGMKKGEHGDVIFCDLTVSSTDPRTCRAAEGLLEVTLWKSTRYEQLFYDSDNRRRAFLRPLARSETLGRGGDRVYSGTSGLPWRWHFQRENTPAR